MSFPCPWGIVMSMWIPQYTCIKLQFCPVHLFFAQPGELRRWEKTSIIFSPHRVHSVSLTLRIWNIKTAVTSTGWIMASGQVLMATVFPLPAHLSPGLSLCCLWERKAQCSPYRTLVVKSSLFCWIVIAFCLSVRLSVTRCEWLVVPPAP